jgi:hypothetical protein
MLHNLAARRVEASMMELEGTLVTLHLYVGAESTPKFVYCFSKKLSEHSRRQTAIFGASRNYTADVELHFG